MDVPGIETPSGSVGIDGIISTVGGVGLGAYLIAVVFQGNGKTLLTEVTKDWQYLEFLVAIYILYALHASKWGGQIVTMLIQTAIVALLIKMAAASGNGITEASDSFAAGKLSLFQYIQTVLGFAAPKTS